MHRHLRIETRQFLRPGFLALVQFSMFLHRELKTGYNCLKGCHNGIGDQVHVGEGAHQLLVDPLGELDYFGCGVDVGVLGLAVGV